MRAQRISRIDEVAAAVKLGLSADGPHFIEVKASLALTLPRPRA
jgi:hypothetical protein